MEWKELHDKSEWLFQKLFKKTGNTTDDKKLESLARKLEWKGYIREKIDEQEKFDYLKAYRKTIGKSQTRQLSRTLKITAAILLLLGSGSTIYLMQDRPHNIRDQVIMANIHSGTHKAFLIKHDGQKMELKQDKQHIKEQNGTDILIDSSGIHYENGVEPSRQKIIHHTLVVPRGGEFFLTLSDGTKVWLNADSRLEYPVRFADSTREVTISGEAYFEVQHSTIPFIVKTDKGNINVLGTSFNVNNYPGNRESVITLISGKIAYSPTGGGEIILIPDQQISINDNGLTTLKNVDPQYVTSWKDGMFLFQEMRLEDIMNQLERWYDIHTFYTDENIKDLHFSGDLSRFKNIDTFIEMFEESSNVKIKVQGKNLIIGI